MAGKARAGETERKDHFEGKDDDVLPETEDEYPARGTSSSSTRPLNAHLSPVEDGDDRDTQGEHPTELQIPHPTNMLDEDLGVVPEDKTPLDEVELKHEREATLAKFGKSPLTPAIDDQVLDDELADEEAESLPIQEKAIGDQVVADAPLTPLSTTDVTTTEDAGLKSASIPPISTPFDSQTALGTSPPDPPPRMNRYGIPPNIEEELEEGDEDVEDLDAGDVPSVAKLEELRKEVIQAEVELEDAIEEQKRVHGIDPEAEVDELEGEGEEDVDDVEEDNAEVLEEAEDEPVAEEAKNEAEELVDEDAGAEVEDVTAEEEQAEPEEDDGIEAIADSAVVASSEGQVGFSTGQYRIRRFSVVTELIYLFSFRERDIRAQRPARHLEWP